MSFDALLETLTGAQALGGVVAFYHFTWPGQENVAPAQRSPNEDWPFLAEAVLGKAIELPNRYGLLDPTSDHRAPFYINYGMLCGPPALLKHLHRRDIQIRDRVERHTGEWWAPQISLALAAADLELPAINLPIRYNFPNHLAAETLYPEEMNDIVFLHYMNLQYFNRQRVFASDRDYRRFIGKRYAGSSELFRRFVEDTCGKTYPFA